MEKVKRYFLFMIGLFINALGVSLVTKASLGTSPISSIPYVLSLNFNLTLGNFTIIFSIFLILLQIIILRRNFKIENILQIPVSILFGYFIDLTMYLFVWLAPQNYLISIITLLIGCFVLGFGVYLEVLADVVMLPGESFVRAIVQTWKTNFGTTKIIFDTSMSLIAAVLSFGFFGKLNGVREGTIVAALLVGFVARVLGKKLEFIKPILFKDIIQKEDIPLSKDPHRHVIVIGREYGSGGHDIAKQLAKDLNYDFYDHEIIEMVAGTSGMKTEFIEKNEESMPNNLIYDLVNQAYIYGDQSQEAPKDQIFDLESKVIKDLSQKGNCVIVGRCSDYILKDDPHVLKIFLFAPVEKRIKNMMERKNISENKARVLIHKEDKHRRDNYHYYTNRTWGMAQDYDLTINTELGISFIEECIKKAL